MAVLKMSDEEKKKILEKHKGAIKNESEKKDNVKKGLQKPEKKENLKNS
jgi:hypothetical protein